MRGQDVSPGRFTLVMSRTLAAISPLLKIAYNFY